MVSDIANEIKDVLAFHLGCGEERLIDDARLIADLGADSLDIIEIMMSCEEKFSIDIPNHVAARLISVGDTVRWITVLVTGSAESGPVREQPTMGRGQTS